MFDPSSLDPDQPVLIAGPTASGKSALALEISARTGGRIVNADALQVYEGWRVLTARPGPEDLCQAPHALYGHVAMDRDYSVGDWMRDLAPFLDERPAPIIVGGTGLYFRALTEGLADIPEVPAEIREEARARTEDGEVAAMLAELDAETAARIDTANPRRVQRAWEVLKGTGKGLMSWQDATPPPVLPLDKAHPLLLDADRDWLAERIARRFDMMLEAGALDEVQDNLADWTPDRASSAAIGAPELVAYLNGDMSLAAAREAAVTSTRQYAKRQRTWFRARMASWHKIALPLGDTSGPPC
ncbi:MAG: tRNA (adenosine(37)-N6)-dimethylallyltransferase MiaA [Pseudomonadota bacterium]